METGRVLEGLNDEQRRAVEAVRGPVCILAGAGSGKTTTITRRIANQVASNTFPAGSILAVTFTDKAAGEMRSRLGTLGVEGVVARTFHSAARAQLYHLGAEPLGQILASKAVPLRQIANTLPRPYRFRPAGDLATEIEWARNRRIGPEQYLGAVSGHEPPIPADLMASVFTRYEKGKRDRGLIDFEDLLELAIRLFQTDESARERFHERYRAFTVDEYQDVNLLQETLLNEWIGGRDDICVVGDDYQSIYGFTGATPRYLLEMPQRFARTAVIRLETNYRSTPQILNVANKLVPKLGGAEKILNAANPDGEEPMMRMFSAPTGETSFIVGRIRTLAEAGVPLEEMAILYRVNFRSEDYEEALAADGIPYQVRDGAFLNRATARQMLSVLKRSKTAAVAAQVRQVAERSGYLEDLPDGLGDQEITRQNDLGRFIRLADEFDDGERTGADFATDIQNRFGTEGEGRGVNLMTLHRAKGLEFDAVFLPRVEEGELPFKRSRTDEAIDEERRLFYVGVTRARKHLAITWVNDGKRKGSRFVGELRGETSRSARSTKFASDEAVVAAEVGLEVTMAGGFTGEIVDITDDSAVVEIPGGSDMVVPFGERVTARGKKATLVPPKANGEAFDALKKWRLERSKADGVPAYVVFHDSTLEEIAARRPTSPEELADVPGVGPAKLERYGSEVIDAIAGAKQG